MHRRILIVASMMALAAVLLLGLGMLAGVAPPGYTRVDLTEGEKGRVLLSDVLRDGERITLTWRNSQFGLDVTEVFFARSGVIIQDRVVFAIPGGAPPPRVSPGEVADLFHPGGPFDARGISRPFSRIVYRVGEIGNPRMQIGERTVWFKKDAGFGGRVVLTAARPVLYEILLDR